MPVQDDSGSIDKSELLDVADLLVDVLKAGLHSLLSVLAEMLEEGACDALLAEVLAQYVGTEELSRASATKVNQSSTTQC